LLCLVVAGSDSFVIWSVAAVAMVASGFRLALTAVLDLPSVAVVRKKLLAESSGLLLCAVLFLFGTTKSL
jgi:hypothetical protein